MKTTLLFTVALIASVFSFAQNQDPVHWKYSTITKNDKQIEVHMIAAIDSGWHIYSQTQPPEAISEPTTIVFEKNPLVTITGKAAEIGRKEKYEDKATGIVQYQYGGTVEFVQNLTLKSKAKTNLTGTITYQACTGEMCLPPKTVNFNISVN